MNPPNTGRRLEMHAPSFSRPGCSPSSPNPASGGDHGAAAGAAPAAQAQTAALSQPEMFQQHKQGHQLLLSPSGGERRMLETMAESHVKILTECSLQLSLSDVLPASPYGKHGRVSGQGKSFGHAGFAPCMVSNHKPQLCHSQYRGTKQEPSARVHKAGGTRLSWEGCCQRGLHGSTRSGSQSPATPRRDAES